MRSKRVSEGVYNTFSWDKIFLFASEQIGRHSPALRSISWPRGSGAVTAEAGREGRPTQQVRNSRHCLPPRHFSTLPTTEAL